MVNTNLKFPETFIEEIQKEIDIYNRYQYIFVKNHRDTITSILNFITELVWEDLLEFIEDIKPGHFKKTLNDTDMSEEALGDTYPKVMKEITEYLERIITSGVVFFPNIASVIEHNMDDRDSIESIANTLCSLLTSYQTSKRESLMEFYNELEYYFYIPDIALYVYLNNF